MFGLWSLPLDLDLQLTFRWVLIAADVNQPSVGSDLLTHLERRQHAPPSNNRQQDPSFHPECTVYARSHWHPHANFLIRVRKHLRIIS